MAGFFEDDDIDTMLDDSPHSITIAGVTTGCWFDDGEELSLDGRGSLSQVKETAQAYIKTSAFPTLAGNAACVITFTLKDGAGNVLGTTATNWTVWRRMRERDGAVSQLILRKA